MKRVLVGISGGVDSSVAALVLKNKGYEVIGITFIFNDNTEIEDAKKICQTLNVKHYIYDYKDEFKEKIIDNFINDYKNGLTPNPCILCNKTMKLKLLYDKMLELNCDYISTGHYAKISDDGLYVGKDLNKDQTYFLSSVKREILEKLVFPLENLNKEEVRNIALKNNLITANKKDSTDICFINNGNFKEFMKKYFPNNPGKIIDIETNKIIGDHIGLMYYTIGQRRGLNIGGTKNRCYVVGKNIDKNILYVSCDSDEKYLYSNSCIIDNINWLAKDKITKCSAKFRYRQPDNKVDIEFINNDMALVKYDNIKAITPGQVCVFYKNNKCLGSGIIKEVRKDSQKLWYL